MASRHVARRLHMHRVMMTHDSTPKTEARVCPACDDLVEASAVERHGKHCPGVSVAVGEYRAARRENEVA